MANPVIYVRLTTRNKDTAKTFYLQLFDWEWGEPETHNGRVFYPWDPKDPPTGDLVNMLEEEPLGWVPMVEVEKIDTSIQQAIVLGGRVLVGKTDHDKFYYAYIEDPTGAVIGLYQKK